MSMRALAAELHVSAGHLSRVLRCADGKRPTLSLLRRMTDVLDLPPGYFVETRRASVLELVGGDNGLIDRLYDEADVAASEETASGTSPMDGDRPPASSARALVFSVPRRRPRTGPQKAE